MSERNGMTLLSEHLEERLRESQELLPYNNVFNLYVLYEAAMDVGYKKAKLKMTKKRMCDLLDTFFENILDQYKTIITIACRGAADNIIERSGLVGKIVDNLEPWEYGSSYKGRNDPLEKGINDD